MSSVDVTVLVAVAITSAVVFGTLCAGIWHYRGAGPSDTAAGFFCGVVLGPFGLLVVLLVQPPRGPSPKRPRRDAIRFRRCPHCSTVIRFNDSRCDVCGRDVAPLAPPTV